MLIIKNVGKKDGRKQLSTIVFGLTLAMVGLIILLVQLADSVAAQRWNQVDDDNFQVKSRERFSSGKAMRSRFRANGNHDRDRNENDYDDGDGGDRDAGGDDEDESSCQRVREMCCSEDDAVPYPYRQQRKGSRCRGERSNTSRLCNDGNKKKCCQARNHGAGRDRSILFGNLFVVRRCLRYFRRSCCILKEFALYDKCSSSTTVKPGTDGTPKPPPVVIPTPPPPPPLPSPPSPVEPTSRPPASSSTTSSRRPDRSSTTTSSKPPDEDPPLFPDDDDYPASTTTTDRPFPG